MHQHLADLLSWYSNHLESGGYLLIILLMAMESSVVPIPSEFVIPPAAYLAFSKHNMSVPGVVIAGAVGCVVGSVIMYLAAFLAGRPLVLKYGKYVWITPEKLTLADRWTKRYGGFGIFLSRFVPVIRHLIGLPAGLVRMDSAKFILYTFLGSGIWCTVLAIVGIKAGQDEALRSGDVKSLTIWIGGSCIVLAALYIGFVVRLMKKQET